jgi:rhodanese-related sulfurtransferase
MSAMTPDEKREVKNALYEEFARIGKAASSSRRLELLDLLSQGEKAVEVLAHQANLTVKNASAQLKVLRNARLVETRKSGQRVFYRLASQAVFRFWMALQSLGEAQYAELRDISERYYADPDGLDPIDRKTLVSRARHGDLVVIDVRPMDEYLEGHLPGARSIPITELTKRLESLPRDKEIVAYCRGRYCVYAIEAVAVLRRKGFRAVRFEESVPQWREAGLAVEKGPDQEALAVAVGEG